VRSAFDILERELMLDAAGHSAAGFDSSLRAQTRRVLDVIERYENAWQIGR
jgi:hypothetical protein